MRKWTLVALVLLVIASLACSTLSTGLSFGATATPTSTNTPTLSPLPTETPTPEVIRGIDTPISFGEISLTVTDAYFAEKFYVGEGQFLLPKDGYNIFAVKFDYSGKNPDELLMSREGWNLDIYIVSSSNQRFRGEYITWNEDQKTLKLAFAPTIGNSDFDLYLDGIRVPLDGFFVNPTDTSGS